MLFLVLSIADVLRMKGMKTGEVEKEIALGYDGKT